MKLLGTDLVLLVVGVLLIGGAAWPLVAGGYLAQNAAGGGATVATSLYDVAFSTTDQPARQQNILSLASGNSVFLVVEGNVTKVHIEITCTDSATGAQASPFTFTVNVAGPNGTSGTATGRTCAGTTAIDVPVASVPAATKASAPDARTAEATAGNGTSTKAKGEWKITTSGSRSVGVLPVAAPNGIVKLATTTWTAKATPAAPAPK